MIEKERKMTKLWLIPLLLLFPNIAQANQITPAFTQGSMQATTTTTQVITETIDTDVYGGAYNSWSGTNVVPSGDITDAAGNVVASGGGAASSEFSCLDDGDYTATGTDSWGDSWNGNILSVIDDDGTVYLSWEGPTTEDGTNPVSVTFTVGESTPPPPVLLISEYCDYEPSGYSGARFLEIYNPTDTAFDLGTADVDTNLYIAKYSNGSSSSYSTALFGTIAPNDVFVIANNQDKFVEIFGFEADQYSSNISGNGDDVFALSTSGYPADPGPNVFDILGEIGVDGSGTA